MKIVDAVKHAQKQLAESDSARLDAEILLCSVLKCERTHLYTHPEQALSKVEINSFNELIVLRTEGHPIAHLIQKKEFWSLELKVTADTLIPRPETEVLVETALSFVTADTELNILDLGTGSGAIAIAIASERPTAKITATDTSEKALIIAKQNADSHKIENIEFKKANWLDKESHRYDIIVSNPPYMHDNDPHLKQGDVRFEPLSALASGNDGLDNLRTIIYESKKYLNNQAWLLVEHGYNQGEQVKLLFIENNFTSVSTIKDYGENDRVTIGQFI